jgi:Uma2 family endonuclease
MATTLTRQMTVEEFYNLPEAGPFYYELRNGELVQVTRPKFKHYRLQRHLREVLESTAGASGVAEIEFAFRALPEYELRVADLAWVARERWNQIDPEDALHGAPDLVIEIVSASNTAAEMAEKEKLCLETGCREFWTVYPKLNQVKVSTPDGITTTFRAGQEIPLRLFGGGGLKVDAIFS